MSELPGEINVYDCPACGGSFVTIIRDEGTTPSGLQCRLCGKARAESSFYASRPECGSPTFEWFRPRHPKRYSPAMREHIERGGLVIRAIR